jgi:hypothetical protein
MVHCSRSNIIYCLGESLLEGRRELKKVHELNMICLFTEIYWSLDEVIMKQIGQCLYVQCFLRSLQYLLFLQYIFN